MLTLMHYLLDSDFTDCFQCDRVGYVWSVMHLLIPQNNQSSKVV